MDDTSTAKCKINGFIFFKYLNYLIVFFHLIVLITSEKPETLHYYITLVALYYSLILCRAIWYEPFLIMINWEPFSTQFLIVLCINPLQRLHS